MKSSEGDQEYRLPMIFYLETSSSVTPSLWMVRMESDVMGLIWESFTPFSLGVVNQVSIKGSSQPFICDSGKTRDLN